MIKAGGADCKLKLAEDAQRLGGQAAERPWVFYQAPERA